VSQPSLINDGIYDEKPRSNIYTAMLGVAFLSLCVATFLLSLEMSYFENDFKAAKPKAIVVPIRYEPKVEATEETPPADGPGATETATADSGAPAAAPSATPAATPEPAPTATAAPSATAAPAATAPAATGSPTSPAATAASGTAAPMPTGM
jgi:hypothetical protein